MSSSVCGSRGKGSRSCSLRRHLLRRNGVPPRLPLHPPCRDFSRLTAFRTCPDGRRSVSCTRTFRQRAPTPVALRLRGNPSLIPPCSYVGSVTTPARVRRYACSGVQQRPGRAYDAEAVFSSRFQPLSRTVVPRWLSSPLPHPSPDAAFMSTQPFLSACPPVHAEHGPVPRPGAAAGPPPEAAPRP